MTNSTVRRRKRFALIGAAGFVAPAHFDAIKSVGGDLVAACDICDSVQRIDHYFPSTRYFRDPQLFAEFLRDARQCDDGPIDFLSVCTPDHLRLQHVSYGLDAGCDVICEKPLCRDNGELERLKDAEERSGQRIFCIQQLRCHPALLGLKERVASQPSTQRSSIDLAYITHRGPWYEQSWRGDPAKGAGLISDIGIHFLDMLLWVWGPLERSTVSEISARHASGSLALRHADVRWYLSLNRDDMRQFGVDDGNELRRILVDGRAFELSKDFHSLHTACYRTVLGGSGLRIEDVRPTIELCAQIQSFLPTGGPI